MLLVHSIDPPGIQITHPGALSHSAWTPFALTLQTSAPPDTALWWSLSNAPTGITINSASGTISGWSGEAGGEITFDVAVSDGYSSDTVTLGITCVDQDADGDGVMASKEHELALAWDLPLHDGEAYSSRGNAAEGAHDWLYYYYSELVYNDLWSDTDEDGLGSQLEQFLGTNPDLKDSDGDFRPDWWQRYQAFNRFHLTRDGDGTVIDQDGDGLPFSLEILIGSNDGSLDSDGDGLGDEWEWVNASYSDINLSDTDADGLSDMEEYNAGTYARMADSDGDFLTDREELQGLFGITLNPLDQDSDDDGLPDWTEVDLTDSDGAGIPDLLEEFWGLDKIDPLDEHGDLDGDVLHGGFTNLQAYQHGWDVRARFDPLFDRDGDGMTNNYELARGLEPDDKTDGADDADADFLTNAEEYKHRTSHTLLLTPARAHEGDLDSPLKKVNAPDVWGHYAFRDVQNDFEVAFGSALPSNLLRDNGPHSGRQHDDDWDQDGMSNFQELYPPSGPPSNPRSYDAPLEITRPPDKVEPGGAYDTVLMASGGITPYQFRVKEGNQLPAWLTLIGARLAGTAPSAPITEPSFSLVCRDTRGSEVEMAVSVRVAPPPPPFSWQTPADLGYVDVTSGSVSYSTVLSTAHGNGSVSFTAENLPAGCTLSSTGEFVGTFANGETTAVSFSVTATDQASPPESIVRTFTLALRPVVETLAVTPFTPPIVIPGAAYGPITVTTTGGQGAVVVSVVGQLPPGFAFDGSSFSGTAPAYLDPFTVTFRASDSQDPPQEAFYTASFTVPSIPGVPTLLGPPMITGGEPCNFRLQVIGGGWQEPYSLTLLSGELPPGLTYNAATHTLSGTTTAYDWSSNLVFWAAGVGPPVELPWTLKTSQRPVGPLKISGVNEISVVRGTFVYRTFRAYDGFRPWQYVLPPAASLPVGISSRSGMEWDGLKAYLVGTPSELTAGWQPITISAVDDQGRRVDHVVNFRVLPPVEISDNLTVVKPGSPVSMHLAASGGSGGYIWQVGTGGLPAGLTLNASGTLTGTPSAPGVSYFTLHAQDNEGNRVSRDFALESAPAASGGSPPPPSFQLQAHSQSVTFSYDSGGEKSEVREIIGTGAAAKMQLLMDGWNEFDDGDSDPETWLLKKTVTVDISPSGYYKYQATGEGSKDIKTSEQVVDIIKNGGDRPTLDDSMKETGSFKDSGFINASGNLIATSGSSRGFPIAQWYDFRMKASDPVQADTPFTFLKVSPPPPGSPVTASPTIKSITITIPKGGTVSTKGGDKAGLISLHPYGGSRQHLLPVEFITPAGDPVNAPVDAGTNPASIPDGANEFTFTDATSGVLTMKLKAKVPGIGSMPAAEQAKFAFEVDIIGSSTFTWDGANPGGKATVSGDFITATATYTGLPQNNTDFGLKKAKVKYGATATGETQFEVFFPRDADNHPGGQAGSPNWFYYWKQLAQGHNIEYGGVPQGSTTAEVKAVTLWSYGLAKDKTLITLYKAVCGKFKGYGVGEEFSGIDRFFGSMLHEAKHVDQIARADQLVATGQAGPSRNGWSFNQGANHNHWTTGGDGKPGVSGIDDDGDGTIDNLVATGPGELGHGDDVDLTHLTTTSRNWPSSWAIPSPLKVPSEIESEAINYSDQQHDENKRARDDWGNPGKNHKTIDKWDD